MALLYENALLLGPPLQLPKGTEGSKPLVDMRVSSSLLHLSAALVSCRLPANFGFVSESTPAPENTVKKSKPSSGEEDEDNQIFVIHVSTDARHQQSKVSS